MNDPPLTRLRELRKQELLRAAYELGGAYGLNALTVESVARHAGSSKGIIHHYFVSKDDVIEQTVRYAHARFRQRVLDRLRWAVSPSERLWSVIAGNFAPDIYQAPFRRLWLSIFEAAKSNPRLARLCEIVDRRTVTHITMPLRQLVASSVVEPQAAALLGLMDGCWFLAAAEPEVTRKAALSVIAEYLRTHVPRFDMSVVKLDG